uniref:Uncharacterized protein n=1 Tax=Triticum urartu TaxID=4572 RepID=A0A8R7R2V8_TRIUA
LGLAFKRENSTAACPLLCVRTTSRGLLPGDGTAQHRRHESRLHAWLVYLSSYPPAAPLLPCSSLPHPPNSSPLASFSSRRTSPIWIGFDGVFMPPRATGLPLQLPSSGAVVALFFPSSPAPTPHPQPPPPRGRRLRFGSQVLAPRHLHPLLCHGFVCLQIWIGVQLR